MPSIITTLRRIWNPSPHSETFLTGTEPPENDRDGVAGTTSGHMSTAAPLASSASTHSGSSTPALVIPAPSPTASNDSPANTSASELVVSEPDSSSLLSPKSGINESGFDANAPSSPSIVISDDPSSALPSCPSSISEGPSITGLSPVSLPTASSSNTSLASTSESSFLNVDRVGTNPKRRRYCSKAPQVLPKDKAHSGKGEKKPDDKDKKSNPANMTKSEPRKPNPDKYRK